MGGNVHAQVHFQAANLAYKFDRLRGLYYQYCRSSPSNIFIDRRNDLFSKNEKKMKFFFKVWKMKTNKTGVLQPMFGSRKYGEKLRENLEKNPIIKPQQHIT